MTIRIEPGARLEFSYRVPSSKTVPNLFPEAPELQAMPAVLASGFMIGLLEWTCIKLLAGHLEPGEGSLGVHFNISHSAATLPGQTVTVEAECTGVNGARVQFKIRAHDGIDMIGEGTHERFVVRWDKFKARLDAKAAKAGVTPG